MRSEIIQTEIDMLKKEHTQFLMSKNFQKARQVMKKIEAKTRELNMARGEELIQKAIDNGMFERFNRLISAAQILNCVTNNLIDEATDLLKDNGLLVDGIAVESRTYVKAADRYFKEFGKLIHSDECQMAMFKDLDYFEDWFRKWAKLKDRSKQPSLLRGCLKEARKQNGMSRACAKCQMQKIGNPLICQACGNAFVEGFQKGAKWLDGKRKQKEQSF